MNNISEGIDCDLDSVWAAKPEGDEYQSHGGAGCCGKYQVLIK
jgi:hypothetical protein